MSRNVSKDVLNVVKKKTGKNVTARDVQKVASTVKASTMKNEAQLRDLIQKVSSMVNIKVSEKTTKEIVNAVKKSGMDPNNMEQLVKMMVGKK